MLNGLENQELGIIAAGNAGSDEDHNWRIRIDASGQLVIEKRESDTWVNKNKWT